VNIKPELDISNAAESFFGAKGNAAKFHEAAAAFVTLAMTMREQHNTPDLSKQVEILQGLLERLPRGITELDDSPVQDVVYYLGSRWKRIRHLSWDTRFNIVQALRRTEGILWQIGQELAIPPRSIRSTFWQRLTRWWPYEIRILRRRDHT